MLNRTSVAKPKRTVRRRHIEVLPAGYTVARRNQNVYTYRILPPTLGGGWVEVVELRSTSGGAGERRVEAPSGDELDQLVPAPSAGGAVEIGFFRWHFFDLREIGVRFTECQAAT